MPTEFKNKTALSIWWKEDTKSKFEELCEKTKIPKAQLAIDIITQGLTFTETFHKIGFFHLAVVIRDIKDWVVNGNKKEKLEGKTYTIWVEKSLIKRMDKICKVSGISKSKLASNYIKISVEDKDFSESLSDIAYPKAIAKWSEKIKNKLKKSVKKELSKIN